MHFFDNVIIYTKQNLHLRRDKLEYFPKHLLGPKIWGMYFSTFEIKIIIFMWVHLSNYGAMEALLEGSFSF